MKCIKCMTKNINQANYCKKCGYEFNDKEREIATKWTPVWILERIEKVVKFIKGEDNILGVITGTLAFKIISLLVVLGIGVYSVINNGTDVKIRESDVYKVQFNTEANEYYLLVKQEETKLDMFIPNDVEEMSLGHYEEDGDLVLEKTLESADELVLEAKDNDYYILKVKQGKSENELKMFVYLGIEG